MLTKVKETIRQSKDFLLVFLGLAIFHVLEDSIWIFLARFTEIPIWGLILRGFGVTLISAKFVRNFHNH